jgi:hypothetical protein
LNGEAPFLLVLGVGKPGFGTEGWSVDCFILIFLDPEEVSPYCGKSAEQPVASSVAAGTDFTLAKK